MTYKETVDYLFSRLPMFTRVGAAAYKPDIGNIALLCERLGNPHKQFKTIHVAGTNGKGSVSHTLAAVLMQAGFKTGLFTSPHLIDFRERIKVNGKMIGPKKVVDFVSKNMELIEEVKPSFFELTVALAFDYFAAQKPDIVVVETGLGGRLDSTNIIEPEVSVITNIGFDHTDLLGNSLEQIAFEKAGIIKLNAPVIIGRKQSETSDVFIDKSKNMQANLVFSEDLYALKSQNQFWENGKYLATFTYEQKHNHTNLTIKSDLPGSYQAENMALVLATLDALSIKGWNISSKAAETGIQNVRELTGLRGRFELHKAKCLLLFDTGHNEDGIRAALSSIQKLKFNRLYMVLGMVNDKNHDKVLQLLPKDAVYYFCAARIPRALPVDELERKAASFGLNGTSFHSVKAALKHALKSAQTNDLVYVGGSTFIVGEAMQ